MNNQSLRRRSLSALAAAALAAGLGGVLTVPAMAAPNQEETTSDTQYTEAVQLSWDGSKYASTTLENFFADPVSVPGDSATRTLLVRNDGPSDATLRATIVNVSLLDPGAADEHHNSGHQGPDDSGRYTGAGPQGNFYDDLHLNWDGGGASFTRLYANGQTPIAEIPLAQGEQVPITLTYDFPLEATSGNKANVDPRLASFQVLLELGGDLPTDAPTQPIVEEQDVPAPPAGGDPGDPAGGEPADSLDAAAPQTRAGLPFTGADLLWPALGVGLLLGMGALVLGAVRRRTSLRGHR